MRKRLGRCVGLLGGFGVAASVFYYKGLAKAHDDRGVILDLVMTHGDVPRVLAYVQAEDRLGLTEYLLGYIQRLEAAGATCAVLPAVTPHYCIHELQARSPLPVFNLFDPLQRKLAARGVRRVAVFGTKFVMQSKLYGLLPGIEIVPWRTDEETYIYETYTDLALRGGGTEAQYAGLSALAEAMCGRERVDAILLAGTDLASAFDASHARFPFVDCAAVHLEDIAARVLGDDQHA